MATIDKILKDYVSSIVSGLFGAHLEELKILIEDHCKQDVEIIEGVVGSVDFRDNLPIKRLNPLQPRTGAMALFDDNLPVHVKQERGTSKYNDVNAVRKWRLRLVRETDRNLAEKYGQLSEMAQFIYFVNNSIASTYASRYAKNGSGSKYSHGMFFSGLGHITDGGSLNPDIESSNLVYMGQIQPSSDIGITTNSPGALTGKNDMRLYEVSGVDTKRFKVGHSAAIWTKGADNVAGEWALGLDGFKNCEFVEVVAIATGLVTVKQLRFENGQHFTTLAPNGDSFDHPIGSVLMPLTSSQGSVKKFNFEMNITRFCPVDASGRTFVQSLVDFVADNIGYDDSGKKVSINYSGIQNDVSEPYPNGAFNVDVNGDGVKDNGIVDNINEYHLGMQNIRVAFQSRVETAGLPYIYGGTNEHFYRGGQGVQIEHVGSNSSGQHAIDEEQEMDDVVVKMHRTLLFTERFSSDPIYCAVVAKQPTKAFPDGKIVTSNDNLHMKHALAVMCGAPFATLNTIDVPDNWLGLGSVRPDGVCVENTPNSQQEIYDNLGWLGKPVGRIKNVSGIDFSELTPRHSYNFESELVNSTDGWTIAGKNRGGLVINYENNSLVASGYNASSKYGASRIQTEPLLSSDDVGKDLVLRFVLSANCRGVVLVQIANGDWKVYLDEEPTYINISKTITQGDVDSAYQQRLMLNLGRVNEPITDSPQLNLHSVEVFVDHEIDPTVYALECEKGLPIMNGTKRTTITPIVEGVSYRVVDMSNYVPDQQVSFYNNGDVLDSTTGIVLPPETGITLQRMFN